MKRYTMYKPTLAAVAILAILSGPVYADDSVWDEIEGNWKQFSGAIQEQWGELTGDEIEQIEGNREKLLGKIQERYGIELEQAEEQVERWADSLDS